MTLQLLCTRWAAFELPSRSVLEPEDLLHTGMVEAFAVERLLLTWLPFHRSSYVVTCVFVFITAAVLAEICSALPAAGSIYFWAAEAGGRRYGRLFGFIVAWWSTTAWTTFVASNCQAAANFLLSEITIFGLDFPTDPNDIRFRAVQWIVSECFLFIAIGMNYLHPKTYKLIFRLATGVILLDFFLNIIWLPIAVSKSYGFQDASYVFTQTYNETGAPPVWNWMLSYYVTAGILVGFEASGHISEVCDRCRFLILTNSDMLITGDAKRKSHCSTWYILVSCRIRPHWIPTRHSVPVLSSGSGRALQAQRSTAFCWNICDDHGHGWPHLDEHRLHRRPNLQHHDSWSR